MYCPDGVGLLGEIGAVNPWTGASVAGEVNFCPMGAPQTWDGIIHGPQGTTRHVGAAQCFGPANSTIGWSGWYIAGWDPATQTYTFQVGILLHPDFMPWPTYSQPPQFWGRWTGTPAGTMNGFPVMLITGGQELPDDPRSAPPPPITVEGPLSSYTVPGVTQTWPRIGGHVVSYGSRWGEEAAARDLFYKWQTGAIPLGSVIQATGIPLEVRGQPGIVPSSYQVLSSPETPAPPPTTPEEWQVTPPPPAPSPDPDAVDDSDPDPGDPFGEDDQELAEEFPTPIPAPGSPAPSGGVPGPPGAPGTDGAPAPLEAGLGALGGKAGVVVLGLLLVPLFFRKDKKK